MNYKANSNNASLYNNYCDRSYSCWRYNRHIFIGLGAYLNPMSDVATQLRYAFYGQAGGSGLNGTVTYSYFVPSTEAGSWWSYVAANVFTNSATVPAMPWRNPATATEGIMWGRVQDAKTGVYLDDATVTVTGGPTVKTDGNGYYVAALVPASAGGTGPLDHCHQNGRRFANHNECHCSCRRHCSLRFHTQPAIAGRLPNHDQYHGDCLAVPLPRLDLATADQPQYHCLDIRDQHRHRQRRHTIHRPERAFWRAILPAAGPLIVIVLRRARSCSASRSEFGCARLATWPIFGAWKRQRRLIESADWIWLARPSKSSTLSVSGLLTLIWWWRSSTFRLSSAASGCMEDTRASVWPLSYAALRARSNADSGGWPQ